jgi:multiple sugar transport system permease protein
MSNLVKAHRRKTSLFPKVEPIFFLLPFIVGLAIFTIYPFVNVMLMSIRQNYNALTGAYDGIGFENFRFIFQDRNFLASLRNTAFYVLGVVPATTILAILFSVLLNSKIRFKGFFQTAFFMPMVTSVIAVGLVWRWLYNVDHGLFNFLLSLFNIDPIRWLTHPNYAIFALIIYGIWSTLPFTIIIILAGLQSVNPQYAVAAKVDGAKDGLIFKKITLPLLAPTIGLVLILNVITTSRVFMELFPLFNGRPGPGHSLYTMVFFIYEMFYVRWRLGPAAAAAVVLFLVVFIFTMAQLYVQRKWKHH